jgi:hypothetical protein
MSRVPVAAIKDADGGWISVIADIFGGERPEEANETDFVIDLEDRSRINWIVSFFPFAMR